MIALRRKVCGQEPTSEKGRFVGTVLPGRLVGISSTHWKKLHPPVSHFQNFLPFVAISLSTVFSAAGALHLHRTSSAMVALPVLYSARAEVGRAVEVEVEAAEGGGPACQLVDM